MNAGTKRTKKKQFVAQLAVFSKKILWKMFLNFSKKDLFINLTNFRALFYDAFDYR